MKKILFATTNNRKLLEAQLACKDFSIEVEQIILQIDEIQSHEPGPISIRKATEAFRQVKQPVVVTDTFWNIPSLNGFPGGYMKDIAEWFTPEDFIQLMQGRKDKRICFTETITYKDTLQTKVFAQEYWGIIASTPRGTAGNSWDKVAEFDGHTFAERQDQGKTSHDPKKYVWYGFARWYGEKS